MQGAERVERDPQATFGERAGAVLSRRAVASDAVVGHVGSPVPACSAAMYSAY
jgi:hypothetical protein